MDAVATGSVPPSTLTAEDEANVLPATPFGAQEKDGMASVSMRDALRNHPLNKGTPLTIKKNKVARIQVCEIRFNRTKASLEATIYGKNGKVSPI